MENNYEVSADLINILDREDVDGTILFYNLKEDTYYTNNSSKINHQYIPASTFKMPNTLIALELGIVEDEKYVFEWDGIQRSISNWNQDLNLREAFHYSCVSCYQSIAREIGVERMIEYLGKFGYGEIEVNIDNIAMFWLEGKSKISPLEQIQFLEKFYFGRLPLSHRTYSISKKMMLVDSVTDYSLIAKTGRSLSGVSWYIGIVEKNEQLIFFATVLEELEGFDPEKRKRVTMEALNQLSFI